MNEKKMTTTQIAKECAKQCERAYEIIDGELHRLEMEEMTMGKNEFRTFEMDRLQSISLVLLAQRETVRSLAWMIEQDEKKSADESEMLEFLKGNLTCKMEDPTAIRFSGWVFRGDDLSRWETILKMIRKHFGGVR